MEIFNIILYSLLLLAYGVMCALGRLSSYEKIFAWIFSGLLWLGVVASFLLGTLLFLISVSGGDNAQALWLGLALLIIGGLGILLMFKTVRIFLARFMPLLPDSRPQQFGLIFMLPFLAALLFLGISTPKEDILRLMQNSNILSNTLSLELYFTALALIGCGWGYARSTQETRARLGLSALNLRQVLLASGIALAMFTVLSYAVEPLLRQFLPEDSQFLAQVMELIRPGRATGVPALEIILLSVMAGVGEELFFRGLLLPVVGLVPSALLFALIHLQYGISAGLVIVFIAGLLLGYLRMRYSTSFSIVTHIVYDMLAFSAAYFAMP